MALRRVLLSVVGVGGAISNRVFVAPAAKLTTRLSLLAARFSPALAIRPRFELRFPLSPGVLAGTGRASGTLRAFVTPAGSLKTRAVLAFAPTKEAMDLVHAKYDLTQTKGANAAVSTGSAWATPASAQGRRDGTLSTRVGQAAAATDGTLTLDYPDTVSKTALTIQSVVLNFYVQHSSSLAGSTMTLSWRKGAADPNRLLATITATTDALTTPRSFDITASIAGWADLDALQTIVRERIPVAVVADAGRVDAVECVVTATMTEAI